MYGNTPHAGGNIGHQFVMDDQQIEAFRRSVKGVRMQTDEWLTSAFNVGGHVTTTADGQQGVITVSTAAGQMQFNITPKEAMFEGEGRPITADQAGEIGADIAAAAAANFLKHTEAGDIPAQ